MVCSCIPWHWVLGFCPTVLCWESWQDKGSHFLEHHGDSRDKGWLLLLPKSAPPSQMYLYFKGCAAQKFKISTKLNLSTYSQNETETFLKKTTKKFIYQPPKCLFRTNSVFILSFLSITQHPASSLWGVPLCQGGLVAQRPPGLSL